MNFCKLLIYAGMLVLLVACEDVIRLDSGFTQPIMVVDAWLDNLEKTQKITLTWSQDYFNASLPVGIENASVTLVRNGSLAWDFEHQSNGVYEWVPEEGQVIGEVGDVFTLEILWNNKVYTGQTMMFRVPPIDSIAQVFEEEQLGIPEGIYAELFVTDLPGIGDTYWAKTWKNGQFLNKPQEMLLVYDATFDAGSSLDGVPFIFPLRRGINPFPDDFSNLEAPYQPGDEIYVELHSISNEAFRFMRIARDQMTNGDNGIFSIPLANTIGNVVSQDGRDRWLGFFNVSAVSKAGVVVE
ncbi:MAG TPA: DUF4249 family protein [Saprospiraceae bacterium]|nr:DUF4249 family protein [Saprospiraceae bacterium]